MPTDPLAGWRQSINKGKVSRIRYPGDRPCPVEVGDRFALRSCEVLIDHVERKIVKGRPAEWHASFVRIEDERTYLLRRSPPAHAETDQDVDLSRAEQARRDGNYTSSRFAALTNEPESVGPDWQDRSVADRAVRWQQDRNEERMKADKDAEDRETITRLKARITQVATEISRRGDSIEELDLRIRRILRDEDLKSRDPYDGPDEVL